MRYEAVRRRRAYALIFLMTGIAACATTRGAPDPVLAVLSAAARADARVNAVWPGYRPFARGFIIFESDRGAWLVADQPPASPWLPVTSNEPGLAGRLYHRPGMLPGLTGGIDTRYRVGEHHYPAVEMGAGIQQTLARLYHEAFHAYQDSTFGGFTSEYFPADATTAEQIAGIELERRILAAAVQAQGAPADSLIAAFLAIRADRRSTLGDTARAVERMLERKEGTAHLVGYQAASAALGLDIDLAKQAVLEALQTDLERRGGDAASRYYRWRSYGTGAAMAMLLDRTGISWRPEVAAGAALDALLTRAAGVRPSPELLAAARASFGFEELSAAATRIAPRRAADPIAEFLESASHRLVIEVRGGSTYLPNMSFDAGSAGIATPHPGVILLASADRASTTNPAFDLSVEKRPVLVDMRGAPAVSRIVVLLPEDARVDGAAASNVTRPSGAIHRITGSGTEVVVRGGMEVVVGEHGVVTVRITAQ